MSGIIISDSLSKEIFLFLQNNETSFIHSLAQRTNQETFSLTFFSVKKEAKKHPPPPSRPLYWADVIDSRQKPPSIKVLVWLSSLCPYGVRHDLLSAGA
jgi:hypothetical protein